MLENNLPFPFPQAKALEDRIWWILRINQSTAASSNKQLARLLLRRFKELFNHNSGSLCADDNVVLILDNGLGLNLLAGITSGPGGRDLDFGDGQLPLCSSSGVLRLVLLRWRGGR